MSAFYTLIMSPNMLKATLKMFCVRIVKDMSARTALYTPTERSFRELRTIVEKSVTALGRKLCSVY